MRFPVVLFDLDGTLVDSGAMILASMRHATRSVLRRRVADEELLAHVGGLGLTEQMRRLDPDRVEELVRSYREHNEPLHRDLQAFEGMLDVLETLRGQGRRLGIVTSKRGRTLELAFTALPELAPLFDVVVTASDTERHKPHADPLLLALARLGAEPSSAAYVGDSPFDVQAAKAAGVFAIAVSWGGIHAADRLAQEDPDALVHSAEELLGVL